MAIYVKMFWFKRKECTFVSMLSEEINLLDELDNLSKIHFLEREDIDHIMTDMAKQILIAVQIERVNVWIFNHEKTALISIGEYDGRTQKFSKDSILEQSNFPTYFNALYENKIILAEDIYTNLHTKEFNEVYSKPHDIYSLLDIPIRISGQLIGVICYEKTGTKKVFSQNEISFCLSVSFVLASNLESRHRRAAQTKLEKALAEKDILINEVNHRVKSNLSILTSLKKVLAEKDLLMNEVNHRVKNNLSILISLMRLSKTRAKTNDTKILLDEYEQRIFSMLKIHDMLDRNNQFAEVNLSEYLMELVLEYKQTYPQISDNFKVDINPLDYLISTKKAIHVGLIVSEILLNSIKYASPVDKNYQVLISLKELSSNSIQLNIGDNGAGFDFMSETDTSNLGLPLIKDLLEELAFKTSYPTKNHCYYNFEFIK